MDFLFDYKIKKMFKLKWIINMEFSIILIVIRQ
jgi:hypothetical protein